MSDNRLKVVKIETMKGEVRGNMRRAIDEFHEEIINEIHEELMNIEQVKKQITKIRKQYKLPDLSHLTWSELHGLELSSELSKKDRLLEKVVYENVQFNSANQDEVVKRKAGVQIISSQSSKTRTVQSDIDYCAQDKSIRVTNNGIGALETKVLKNSPYFKHKKTQLIEQEIRKALQEIKQMDVSKYKSIKKTAHSNDLLKAQLDVIEQVKSLIFPNIDWNHITKYGTTTNKRWKDIVTSLESNIFLGDINLARLVFEQNIIDMSSTLLVEYRNVIDSENIGEDTFKFLKKHKQSIMQYYVGKYSLTENESDVFVKYLAKMSGLDKGVIYVNSQNMDEYWINAWLKINKNSDHFHRIYYNAKKNNAKNIIVDSFSAKKRPNEYGIDLYFVIKEETQYNVNFGELKVQSGAYDLIKRVENYESLRDLNDYLIKTMPYYYGKHFHIALESGGNIDYELVRKITMSLTERRLTLSDTMGQHLLHKLKNTPEFYNGLASKIGVKDASILYDAIKNQAKLYSLIQHGVFKSFNEERIQDSLMLLVKHENVGIPLKIMGGAFHLKISYDSRGGFLDFEGFSDDLLKESGIDEKKNPLKWQLYKLLDKNIRDSIGSVKQRHIDDIFMIFQHENAFLLKYTEMANKVFIELLSQFDVFKILKNRRVKTSVILGNTSPRKYERWLSSKEQLFTTFPYDSIHSWYFPFKIQFDQRADTNILSCVNDAIHKLFIKVLGENSLVNVLGLKDNSLLQRKLIELIQKTPSKNTVDISVAAMILFLRIFTSPEGLPRRMFSDSGSENLDYRALVFLDSKFEPIKWNLGSLINARDPYVNFMFKPNDIIQQYPHINEKILGHFPIDYRVERGNFKMYFLRSAGSKKNINAKKAKQEYIKKMKRVFSSDMKMLAFIDTLENAKEACLSAFDDLLCGLKTSIFCILEYNYQWQMFTNAIVDFLKSYKGKYHLLPSVGYGSLRIEGWKLEINKLNILKDNALRIKYKAQHTNGTIKKFDEIVTLGIANMKAPSKSVKNWRIKPEKEAIKIFSNYNVYMKEIINILRNDTKNVSFSDDISSDVQHNWDVFLKWIDGVS